MGRLKTGQSQGQVCFHSSPLHFPGIRIDAGRHVNGNHTAGRTADQIKDIGLLIICGTVEADTKHGIYHNGGFGNQLIGKAVVRIGGNNRNTGIHCFLIINNGILCSWFPKG